MPKRNRPDHVHRRNWRAKLPFATKGEGVWIHDDEGNRYLDAVGTVYVVNIGHGVQEVVDAMTEQARRITFPYAGSFTTEAELDAAEEVIEMAPPGMSKVYFVTGGSEANEVAIKFAYYYQKIKGRPQRWRVIGRWQNYHGATMATLSLTGNTARRSAFQPYLLDFPHIPQPYCYRCPWEKTYPGCGLPCAEELDRVIRHEGPDSIAAFICEPISGASSAAVTPPVEYYKRIREICDAHDILFIADEVITGFGRTGANFAVDHYGVVPDLITCGKGIGSGYAPLGAVIIHDRVSQTLYDSEFSSIYTGYTYQGHPVGCAAGAAVLRYLKKHGLVARARSEGAWFMDQLKGLERHPSVGDVRGKGMLVGIEFVKDKASKAVFAPELGYAKRVADAAWRRRMLIRGEAGSIDDRLGEHILLAPPLTATRDELSTIVDVLDAALAEVEKEVGLA